MNDNLTDRERALLYVLRYGQENGRKAHWLAADLYADLSPHDGQRLVSDTVKALRDKEVPIASDTRHGYWLPRTAAEYRPNIGGRKDRAIRQLASVSAEERAAERMALAEMGGTRLPIWPEQAA